MLASFKAENRRRGVQILRAKSPLGPFVPISDGPITPPEWESLDGTLYLDGQGRPWLIFCHEWTQLGDGAICGMRLEKDLSAAAEAPVTLFHASQSGWSVADTGQIVRKTGENYVTDGPFYTGARTEHLDALVKHARCGYAVGLQKAFQAIYQARGSI
ncbi:MAG: family 43 glycosylhydrolase [Ruthenibacterium lactatiformans]